MSEIRYLCIWLLGPPLMAAAIYAYDKAVPSNRDVQKAGLGNRKDGSPNPVNVLECTELEGVPWFPACTTGNDGNIPQGQ